MKQIRLPNSNLMELKNPYLRTRSYSKDNNLTKLSRSQINTTQGSFHENLSISKILRHGSKTKDATKIIPTNILQDKEELYQQNLRLKTQVHSLRAALNISKSKNSALEQQAFKDEKEEIDENYEFTKKLSLAGGGEQKQSLILNLKKQVKDLQQQLYEQDDEMVKIKRNVRLTKIQELETELKAYQDETARLNGIIQNFLRKHYNDYNKSIEQQFLSQVQQIEVMSSEIESKNRQLNSLEMENTALKGSNKNYEFQCSTLVKEKAQLKKQLDECLRELERIRGFNYYYRVYLQERTIIYYRGRNHRFTLNSSQNRSLSYQQFYSIYLRKKMIETNQLQISIKNKEQKIIELEKKNKVQISDLTEQVEYYKQQNELLQEKNTKLKADLEEFSEKYQQIVLSSRQTISKRKTMFDDNITSDRKVRLQRMTTFALSTDESPGKGFQLASKKVSIIKIPVLKSEDLQNIKKEVVFKLRSSKIKMNQINQFLFDQNDCETGVVSIALLIEVFQNRPFLLESNDAVKLARYLVESSESQMIAYNIFLTETVETVENRFLEFIGPYKILDAKEQQSIEEQIFQLFENNQNKPPFMIQCQIEDFQAFLEKISMPYDCIDYIFWRNFMMKNELNLIDMKWFADHFIHRTQSLQIIQVQQQMKPAVKALLHAIIDHMHQNNLSVLKLREQIDLNSNGILEFNEIDDFLKKINIFANEQQINELIDYIDSNQNRQVESRELAQVIKEMEIERESKDSRWAISEDVWLNELCQQMGKCLYAYMKKNEKSMFQVYMKLDISGNGIISKFEFKRCLSEMTNLPLDNSEFVKFFDYFDQSQDGEISLEEFYEILRPIILQLIKQDQTDKEYASFIPNFQPQQSQHISEQEEEQIESNRIQLVEIGTPIQQSNLPTSLNTDYTVQTNPTAEFTTDRFHHNDILIQ